ncbi:MAG: hypothetical protein K9I82_01985 [Chitinophagaceae bacterium]|nr:hypothetical protein [Chitinophagaceae bacterium]
MLKQSAAKPLSVNKTYEESSQTIAKCEYNFTNELEKGSTLSQMSEGEDIVETRNKTFFEKSVELFKNNFDYSLSKYVNAKTKIKIICNKHNFIFEQTPDKHLQGKYPCPICLKENRTYNKGKSNTFEYYEKKYLKNKFENYEYVEGVGWNMIIKLTCKIHGEELVSIGNIRNRKYSCEKCSKIYVGNQKIKNKTTTELELKKIHPALKFDFNNYIKRRVKIKCTCNKHGEFYKSVTKLIIGQGCPKCTFDKLIEKNILIGGYSESLFNNNPLLKNKDGILYYLKINDGKYYKIGITRSYDLQSRICSIKSRGKLSKIEIIFEKKMSIYDAFIIEQKIIKENKNVNIARNWSTEIFSEDISNNVLSYFS